MKSGRKEETGEITKHLDFVSTLTETPAIFSAPELSISKEDEEKISRFLREQDVDSSRMIVGLQPGGNKRDFLWPVSHFASVARHLHERHGATVLVTGDLRDRKLAESLQEEVPFPIKNFCGLLPLELVPALLRHVHLFVSNDTGLAHVAGAVRSPLVVIFGPHSQKRFYPFHEEGKGVVIHRSDVSSISEISSEEVIQNIEKVLEFQKNARKS